MNVEAIKRKAYDWLADVITACNKGDRDELKALMEHVISEEEFYQLARDDGELVNDQGVFRCDGFTFQVCQDYTWSATEPEPTDRYIIWGFAKDHDQDIMDIVYWTWSTPFIADNKVFPSVLDKCKDWVKRAKKLGYKS